MQKTHKHTTEACVNDLITNADTAETERSPHLTVKWQPRVTKYFITRHEETVPWAHTSLHCPKRCARRALRLSQHSGCCRRNQRAIHPRPVYILSVLAWNSIVCPHLALGHVWLTFNEPADRYSPEHEIPGSGIYWQHAKLACHGGKGFLPFCPKQYLGPVH